jgi:hypothetical protein
MTSPIRDSDPPSAAETVGLCLAIIARIREQPGSDSDRLNDAIRQMRHLQADLRLGIRPGPRTIIQ